METTIIACTALAILMAALRSVKRYVRSYAVRAK